MRRLVGLNVPRIQKRGGGWETDWKWAPSGRLGRADLHSVERHDMLVPSTRTQLGRRSFRVAAPNVWNALPSQLRLIIH